MWKSALLEMGSSFRDFMMVGGIFLGFPEKENKWKREGERGREREREREK